MQNAAKSQKSINPPDCDDMISIEGDPLEDIQEDLKDFEDDMMQIGEGIENQLEASGVKKYY